MTTLRFDCSDFTYTLPRVRGPYDIEIGVVATLTVEVDGRLVYREVQFPVVELRLALARWVNGSEVDFEFESMESDETGLVWIRRQPSGRWRVGSLHQDRPEPAELDRAEVVTGVEQLVAVVDTWAESCFGINIPGTFDVH